MKTTLHVFVQDRHINEGERINCSECPVALAIKEELENLSNDFYSISINQSTLQIRKNGVIQYPIIYTPRSVANFIGRFDDDKLAMPFNFKIKVEIY